MGSVVVTEYMTEYKTLDGVMEDSGGQTTFNNATWRPAMEM